jgi:hypothetical protein
MSDYQDHIADAIEADDVLLTFIFSIGDSHNGQVGTCLRVIAQRPGKAISKAKQVLRNRSVENKRGYDHVERHDVEYVANYYNTDKVSEADLIKSETEIYDVVQQEEALRGDYA